MKTAKGQGVVDIVPFAIEIVYFLAKRHRREHLLKLVKEHKLKLSMLGTLAFDLKYAHPLDDNSTKHF